MLSVIIPTLNAESCLAGLLDSLRRQTVPAEIVVIDSSSSDRTVELARSLADRTLVIPRSEFDHGGTRNRAALEAKGDILVFLTQDALPVNEYFLAELTSPLSGEVAASYGRQRAALGASVIEKFARGFNYPAYDIIKSKDDIARLGIKAFFFTNVCSAVRRDKFMEAGCFPAQIILNEDMVLAAKLILSGYKIAYCSKAEVYHSHKYTCWQQLQRNFDIGVSLSLNPWILQYARAEGEGLRYLKEQMKYLFGNGYYGQVLKCFCDTGFRFLGYKLGLNYTKLPLGLRKKLSMHSFFWRNRLGVCDEKIRAEKFE